MEFFRAMEAQYLALTFDDVREETRDNADRPLPDELDLSGRFSRNVDLHVPFVSAAMSTVTESKMAIAMAKLGGIGVIHCGQSVDGQKDEVRRVKFHMSGRILNPVSVRKGRTLESVLAECDVRNFDFRTFPVVDAERRLIGILTSKDFEYTESMRTRVGSVMTPIEQILSAPSGTTLQQAYKIMRKNQINTLPLVETDTGVLSGLYVWSDVKRLVRADGSKMNVDGDGRLRVAAAVPTDKEALVRIGEMRHYLDVAVIDSADGDSHHSFETLRLIKENFPDLDVVVGNITAEKSARKLAERGADGIKVGQGPGSICTTRIETGIGIPQVTAVFRAFRAVEDFDIPVIADGGLSNHGDLSIAIAAGAHALMMGRMVAGTDEAPPPIDQLPNGMLVKDYDGMGSLKALRSNANARRRYNAGLVNPVAEGVESVVPYKGPVSNVIEMCAKALAKSLRYVKAPSLDEHRKSTMLTRITNAGLRESHPHDVEVVNY